MKDIYLVALVMTTVLDKIPIAVESGYVLLMYLKGLYMLEVLKSNPGIAIN